jgi:hypothetical protein
MLSLSRGENHQSDSSSDRDHSTYQYPSQKSVLYRLTPFAMKTNCPGCQYDARKRRERRTQRIAEGKKAIKGTNGDEEAGEDEDSAYIIDAIWAAAFSRVLKTPGQRPTLMNVDDEFIISLAQNAGNGMGPNLNPRGNVAASRTQVGICRFCFILLFLDRARYAHTQIPRSMGIEGCLEYESTF